MASRFDTVPSLLLSQNGTPLLVIALSHLRDLFSLLAGPDSCRPTIVQHQVFLNGSVSSEAWTFALCHFFFFSSRVECRQINHV